MRKPNSAAQNPSILHATGLRCILLVVILPVAFSIGCSQLQKPASFEPMPQPKSLTERQQRPVEQILQRQDKIRRAEQQAAAEAIAEAEAIAAETDGFVADTEDVVVDLTDDEALESQQQDIVAEAAERANALQPMETDFQVAQVSYESNTESEADVEPVAETESEEPAIPETEAIESNVKLIANADDMEGVPENFARDEIDFSTANFLRPSMSTTLETSGEDLANVDAEDPPTPFGDAQSLSLPLQPMLFNPTTRTKKSILEGTLRPMQTATQDIEPEIEVTKVVEPPQFGGSSFGTLSSYGPLTPLRRQTSTIKLESTEVVPDVVNSSASRLLKPIDREVVDNVQPPAMTPAPTPQVEMVEASTIEPEPVPEVANFTPEPIIVSEQIIDDPVAQPVVVTEPVVTTEPEAAPETKMDIVVAPFETQMPLAPMRQHEQVVPFQPVVDETLAQTSASYLTPKPQPTVNEEAYIPVEVFEDAIVVAEDMERELTAAAIPSVTIEEANDFKIQTTSNTTVTPVCASCGSDSCEGCEYDEIDDGEPMFTNNDFGAPAVPGGDFVAPMAVPPAAVPDATPDQIVAATSEFGKPVTLDAPPESDATVTRVAALPVTGFSSPAPSASNVPPVGLSTLMELNAVTWKSRLDEAIELAETRLNRIKNPADASVVNLRLLKALRGQMEQVEAGPGNGEYTENESQYWQHQLEAITTMLGSPVSTGQNTAVTDYHRHQTAHETLEHLRSAVAELESIASLKVTSGQFCTEISGFGQFRTFPSNTFSAGQKMLVYCEVENYKTVEHQTATGNDFRTRLRGSFAIYDASGKVVQQAEFPTVDDVARKRRRDFYMYLPVTLGDLPAGEYVLHALVEDIYGNKTASLDPPLSFWVE